MSAEVIISYDGTANDDDALVLGKLLAADASGLALAYVRHAPEFDPSREALAQHDAERRLEHGAALLGNPMLSTRGLRSIYGGGAGRARRDRGGLIIVFASDYRTPPGHAEPPTSAQRLLEIGATSPVGVAAAGLRADTDAKIGSIAVLVRRG